MRISTTVQTIAEALDASSTALSPSQQTRIGLLRLMPAYAEVRDLGAWEQAYQGVPTSDAETDFGHLLDAVFEFGGYNLYCAFDLAGTRGLYACLSERLCRAGINHPAPDEFTGF